jgi:hypothetical protein
MDILYTINALIGELNKWTETMQQQIREKTALLQQKRQDEQWKTTKRELWNDIKILSK